MIYNLVSIAQLLPCVCSRWASRGESCGFLEEKKTTNFGQGRRSSAGATDSFGGKMRGERTNPSSPVADIWDLHVNLTKENGWSPILK